MNHHKPIFRRSRMVRSTFGIVAALPLLAMTLFAPSAGALVAQKTSAPLASVTLVGPTVSPPDPSNVEENVDQVYGYYQSNGLNVTETQVGGSPLAVAAIESGSAQFAAANFNAMANADAQGAGIVAVCGYSTVFPGDILAGPGITKVSQLAGKKMAISAQGATDQITPLVFLKKKINTSTLTFAVDGASSLDAEYVISGTANFTWVPATLALLAQEQDPSLNVIADPTQIAKVFPAYGGVILVTKSYADSHAKIVEDFCKATIEANRALYQHEYVFAHTVGEVLPGKYTAAQEKTLWKAYRPGYAVNGGAGRGVLDKNYVVWQTLVNPAQAHNPNVPSFNALFDVAPDQSALKSLGLYPGLDRPTLLSSSFLNSLKTSKQY